MTVNSTALDLTSGGKKSTSDSSSGNMRERLEGRQANDMVLAFCGAIGSRINEDILTSYQEVLESEGYKYHTIKISKIIETAFNQGSYGLEEPIGVSSLSSTPSSKFDRYQRLQILGNTIREKLGDDALARLCIQEIAIIRKQESYKHTDKVAYLISQLKHPAEIQFFRLVYSNIFYLIGTLCSEEQRKHNLHDKEEIPEDKVAKLIQTDRNENDSHGQKLEKVLHSSDLFINNTNPSNDHRKKVISRFVGLTHGINGLTPTNQETGMYAAHTASLRSACLSRQVGAAIMSSEGSIIATGCNDVPKFGGGLYNADSIEDNRCVHYEDNKCFNDTHKSILTRDIKIHLESILQTEIQNLLSETQSEIHSKALAPLLDKIAQRVPSKATEIIANKTQVKDLIEYSRAIHAEMDAIISLSRQTNQSTNQCTLFTTTYPCHNCARHIVTAGIREVVYIEPYEKSLATRLHHDSISKNKTDESKVAFLPFEGVSPRRYADLFKAHNKRKESGSAVKIKVRELNQVIPTYIDSYLDREINVVRYLQEQFSKTEKV